MFVRQEKDEQALCLSDEERAYIDMFVSDICRLHNLYDIEKYQLQHLLDSIELNPDEFGAWYARSMRCMLWKLELARNHLL